MPAVPDVAPAGPDLHQATILLEELGAVKIAAAIEEDFTAARRAVNQIASELIGSEQAAVFGQMRIGRHRELIGRKTGRHGAEQTPGGQNQEGCERQSAEPRIERSQAAAISLEPFERQPFGDSAIGYRQEQERRKRQGAGGPQRHGRNRHRQNEMLPAPGGESERPAGNSENHGRDDLRGAGRVEIEALKFADACEQV
jgi:hypothetical protein